MRLAPGTGRALQCCRNQSHHVGFLTLFIPCHTRRGLGQMVQHSGSFPVKDQFVKGN